MSVVSIVGTKDVGVEEAVRQAVELAGRFPPQVTGADTVLVKPNVVNPSPSGSGNITDVRVTEAVTRMLLELGIPRVVIGEGSSVGYDFVGLKDTMHCLEVSGTADVARRLGVELADLNQDERVQVEAPDAYVMDRFAVAHTAYEADAIVCLPVVKTHVRTGITCGLKNMKGVLPGDEKKRTHRLGLDRGIVDLNRVMRPAFVVVDAIVGRQGTHTSPEDAVRLDRVLAGGDVVAVDTVCAAVMGFDPRDIHHVQLADEAGLGVADLEEITVRGESIAYAVHPFVPYQEAARERFGAATIIEGKACTGCMGEMVSTFIYLRRAGYEDRLEDLTLILGTPEEIPPLEGTPVVVGKCTRAHRERGIWVPGCPPHGTAITDAACQALGIDVDEVHRAIDDLHDFSYEEVASGAEGEG